MNNYDLFIKEIKNAPSALLSYISTREFLRTPEKCREARAVATLVTFGISSLWGLLLSGGRYFRGTKTMKQS